MNIKNTSPSEIEFVNQVLRFEAWVSTRLEAAKENNPKGQWVAEFEITSDCKVEFHVNPDVNFDGKLWRAWVQLYRYPVPPPTAKNPYVAGRTSIEAFLNLISHWQWTDR